MKKLFFGCACVVLLVTSVSSFAKKKKNQSILYVNNKTKYTVEVEPRDVTLALGEERVEQTYRGGVRPGREIEIARLNRNTKGSKVYDQSVTLTIKGAKVDVILKDSPRQGILPNTYVSRLIFRVEPDKKAKQMFGIRLWRKLKGRWSDCYLTIKEKKVKRKKGTLAKERAPIK